MRWDFVIKDIDAHDFMIEVDVSDRTWFRGTVVEIILCYDDDKELWYQSNSSSDSTKERSEARVWIEFSWIWRGCWEGRIYFIDDEFWSSEIETTHILWQILEPLLKEKMKSMDERDLIFED